MRRWSLRGLATVLVVAGCMTVAAGPAAAEPYCDRPNPPPACDGPEEPPPPPTTPDLSVQGVRQTPSFDGVRVWGWAADEDAPTTPLTVNITMDGVLRRSLTANLPWSGIPAGYGPSHGFDVVLPTTAAQPTICVTAVNIGSGISKTTCRTADHIVGFEANDIQYDTEHAVITESALDQLDFLSIRNDSTVQQSTEISGNKTKSETIGWSSTYGAKVTLKTTFKTGIPVLFEGKVEVTVEGSYSYTHNGSTQRSQTFSWRQPVIVPPRSIIEASVAVTTGRIRVGYQLVGEHVYHSGARAAGTVDGLFTGGNSERLEVKLKQFNLDGTPTLAPAPQPRAAMLKIA
ncbi:ETX/MTX2 family pore-forming toxin [Micromonospora sp. NPDC049523]|uniref:ETX/MTX2 family pore-forming toxin n=1 Tax=Micromonospora sp. NPDC049523 TaxID=3155921 RepID=UPI00342C82CC